MNGPGQYAACMQVKQYVAEVAGAWCRFQVFETGDPAFYLFQQLDPRGCATELQFPVRKSELLPLVRKALAHGVGFTAPPPRPPEQLDLLK